MRIFVTGATGFIGSHLVPELIAAGHQVTGLARSEAKAQPLRAAGAEIQLGDLGDPEGVATAAARADAVIHLAFNHDFTRYQQSCDDDRRLIRALGAALAGSGRPLLVTSGTAIAQPGPGQLAAEDSPVLSSDAFPRAASEEAAAEIAAQGVPVITVRLPQVHDRTRQGLVTFFIAAWREAGACSYVGDGANRWPAAHVGAVARLYRLAIERAEPSVYNAVAEQGVAARDIAETVARRLGLPTRSAPPEETAAVFGPFAMFAALDMPATGAKTQDALRWHPTGPTLLDDLEHLELDA